MSKQEAVKKFVWNDISKEPVTNRIDRKIVCGERIMIAHVYLQRGAIVPRHSHENEQITYVISGVLRFWIEDEDSEPIDVRAGEVLVLPSWVPHKAIALEDTLDVDIFTPPRQDWLDGTDTYLRGVSG